MDLLRRAQEVGEIGEVARDFETFMAPEGEDEEPEEQDVDLQEVIDHYTGNTGLEVPPEEATEPTPPPSLAEAHRGLEALPSYLEAQGTSAVATMKHLSALDRELTLAATSQRKQTSISAYFTSVRAAKDEYKVD